MRKKILLFSILFLSFAIITEGKQAGEKIDVISGHATNTHGANSRFQTISADITGNVLTITFNDNVGIAHIVIKDSNGVYIGRDNVFSTPDYATFIINDAGYYRMDITLSNGEQYYGYFQVEN
ncbi:MAG: DUF3244 domain-containing protein [Bacteroidales bacterium]|nr:DUF3244 domain-containing protein [Bacteroidales bacterium]